MRLSVCTWLGCLMGLGCRVSPPPVEVPDPWLDQETISPDPFRLMLTVGLPRSEDPRRLLTLPERGLSFVFDPVAAEVFALDHHYGHDTRVQCLDTAQWETWVSAEQQGTCTEGQVELRRGVLQASEGLIGVAVDPASLEIGLLGTDGTLSIYSADVLDDSLFTLQVGIGIR